MSSVTLANPPAGEEEKIVEEAPAPPPTPRKKNVFADKSPRFWIAFLTLNLTAFISALDAVIIAAALPAITSELNGNSNQAFWSGTAFLLAATITQPLFGTFSEIFGRRNNLLFALTWFLVGSILCARSTYMGMFIGSRVVPSLSITESNYRSKELEVAE
jgi:predicted MFS family arabinose efflux permease